jgi:hypothetical protein
MRACATNLNAEVCCGKLRSSSRTDGTTTTRSDRARRRPARRTAARNIVDFLPRSVGHGLRGEPAAFRQRLEADEQRGLVHRGGRAEREPTLATAGSARVSTSAFCCSSSMAWNDISVKAWKAGVDRQPSTTGCRVKSANDMIPKVAMSERRCDAGNDGGADGV